MKPLGVVAVVAFTAVGVVAALAFQAQYRDINELAANDTWAYWSVNPSDPYGAALSGDRGVFLYSPAAAQAMSVLGWFPWEPVRDVWGLVQVGLLALLAGPFTGLTLLARPIQWELLLGNISLVLAAVAVFGLRWPALWSIGILTKVTPGIGLVWFVARREWRNLGIALGVTAGIAAVSFAVNPQAWFDWFGVLNANRAIDPNPALPFPVPSLPVRLALCAGLVWVGARRDWRWVVPVAVAFSSAHLWSYPLAIAVGSLWYAWTPLLNRPINERAVGVQVPRRPGFRPRDLKRHVAGAGSRSGSD